jgi:flagellar biosynthesis GTPase FlhF
MWGNVQSSKADVENMMQLRSLPGHGATDFYSMTVNANFFLQCIRFLTQFRDAMAGLQPRLEEQERQEARRRAEQEAARERARLQAEEAARQLAQRQAEEAAAARRRAEEAARALAQRKAEEQALQAACEALEQAVGETAVEAGPTDSLPSAETSVEGRGDTRSVVHVVAGPKMSAEVEKAVLELQKDIERAVLAFAGVLSAQAGASNPVVLAELRYTGA